MIIFIQVFVLWQNKPLHVCVGSPAPLTWKGSCQATTPARYLLPSSWCFEQAIGAWRVSSHITAAYSALVWTKHPTPFLSHSSAHKAGIIPQNGRICFYWKERNSCKIILQRVSGHLSVSCWLERVRLHFKKNSFWGGRGVSAEIFFCFVFAFFRGVDLPTVKAAVIMDYGGECGADRSERRCFDASVLCGIKNDNKTKKTGSFAISASIALKVSQQTGETVQIFRHFIILSLFPHI